MRTSLSERIDQLALVWLVVPRKESRLNGFVSQLKQLATGAEDRKELARDSIERLRKNRLVEEGALLKLTDEGRRRALEVLGVAKLPQGRGTLQWAKKVLLLR
ncbi:MAG TPA: hypothetical protein VFQ61_14435, partial [Polyangiaceae bacterium]|nr:hypothetical protein [Polyangiaceae bacterium]